MSKIFLLSVASVVLLCWCTQAPADANNPETAAPGAITPPATRAPLDVNEARMRDTIVRLKAERIERDTKERMEMMEKMKQKNIAEREKFRKTNPDTYGKLGPDQEQLNAIDKQLQLEHTKHSERMARLTRIRELAEAENNQQVLERVNKLIEKEQSRSSEQHRKFTQHQRVLMREHMRERTPTTPRPNVPRDEAKRAIERKMQPPRPAAPMPHDIPDANAAVSK
jgi:hypothetical protein